MGKKGKRASLDEDESYSDSQYRQSQSSHPPRRRITGRVRKLYCPHTRRRFKSKIVNTSIFLKLGENNHSETIIRQEITSMLTKDQSGVHEHVLQLIKDHNQRSTQEVGGGVKLVGGNRKLIITSYKAEGGSKTLKPLQEVNEEVNGEAKIQQDDISYQKF